MESLVWFPGTGERQVPPRQGFRNPVRDSALLPPDLLTTLKNFWSHFHNDFDATERNELKVKSGKAVMENVRRYRAIASLHRQTAAFRPAQRWSLLGQAEQWERLAVAELEAYFDTSAGRHDGPGSPAAGYAVPQPETARGS